MEKDDQFINDMHFDTEKLNNLILTGYEKLQKDQIKNTNIVLVIGCTGSGKSTLINYLISNKIIFKNHFADTIAEAEKTGENFPEIGHSTESKTIYPKVFIDDQHDVAYCDFPGFFDNRSFEERVSITINTQSAILNSKNVEAIIVVLSQAELGAQRGKLFKSLSRLLDNLICDFESILPNIIFVLSKPYNNITSEQFYNHIEELANSNLSFLQDKIKNVAHIFKKQIEPETKERESSYKFLSAIVKHRNNFVVGSFYDQNCRNHIVNLIKSLSVKSIQKDKFNFDKYDGDRMRLNSAIASMSYYGLGNLKNFLNYQKLFLESKITKEESNSKLEFFIKESERIERLLSGSLNQEELLMNQNEKKERREIIENILKEINEKILKETQNIEKINEKLSEAQIKLQNVDTDEPILYWSKNINDKRLKLLGKKSQTKKIIKYKDEPFVDVKLTKINGDFEELKRNDAEGIYETKYKSDIGQDGVATIEIFVMKRNLPDNKKLVRYLKTEISRLEGNHQTAKESINSCEAEKKYCIFAIQNLDKDKTKIDIDKLIFEQDQNRKKIYEIQNMLDQTNERDVKYAQIYEQSKHFIANNLNYFKMIKVVNQVVSFNSELINEFLEYYEKYERLLSSNKKISIFEPIYENDNKSVETRDSDYINEALLKSTLIQNDLEYLKEVENKKNIEENIKQLKLKMQMTEIQLKQSIQRIEKWLKDQEKVKINTESVSTKAAFPPKPSLENLNRLSEQSEQNSRKNDDDFSDSSDYEEIANIQRKEEKF